MSTKELGKVAIIIPIILIVITVGLVFLAISDVSPEREIVTKKIEHEALK